MYNMDIHKLLKKGPKNYNIFERDHLEFRYNLRNKFRDFINFFCIIEHPVHFVKLLPRGVKDG